MLAQELTDRCFVKRLSGPQHRPPGAEPLLPAQARTAFGENSRQYAQRPKRGQKCKRIRPVQCVKWETMAWHNGPCRERSRSRGKRLGQATGPPACFPI